MNVAEDLLRRGISELGIPYDEGQIGAFLTYLDELKRWNRTYNLTGLKTDRDIIIKHFFDSLLFFKVLPPGLKSAADIGSGAGFPGVPIKIISPDLTVFLVEPTGKKAIFLRHVSQRLGLTGIDIIEARLEEIEGLKVEAALTRALFSISEFVEKAKRVLTEDGLLVMSKGPKLAEELKQPGLEKVSVTDLKLPFENITRHLVVIRPGAY